MLTALLTAGADIDFRDRSGDSAVVSASFIGSRKCVEALLDHAALLHDKNVLLQLCNEGLVGGVAGGHVEVVKYCIQMGADMRVRTQDGWPLLSLASWRGYSSIVRELISRGSVIDEGLLADPYQTALGLASRKGHKEVMVMLAEAGASISNRNRIGHSPLIQAVLSGSVECVEYLLQKNADPNDTVPDGMSALAIALDREYFAIAEKLMSAGAETTIHLPDGVIDARQWIDELRRAGDRNRGKREQKGTTYDIQ